MASLQSLAKDTAIYGLSSIVGRFLNYLLFPLYTHVISAASGGNGVITQVYAYTAFLLVMLTFGMETTLFRFINRDDEQDPTRVYTTALMAVGGVALVFVGTVMLNLDAIAAALGFAEHPEYIGMMAAVVAIDAFQAIPFCYLRHLRRPIKFAALKLGFIGMNVLLNLIVFLLLPTVIEGWRIEVGHVFVINLVCTTLVTFGFWKELTGVRWRIDFPLLKRMLGYAWPILVLGIAGILNQTADKMMFPRLIPGHEGKVQLGIYGAAVKIAMIMAIIMQAFRYAYEPFVFASAKNAEADDAKKTYAATMKYFVISSMAAFLFVMAYIDVFQYLMGSDYRKGLSVVPIVMAAEILMGIYFNLSFWYKLTDRTIWGAWFSGAGCLVLLSCNYFFVPRYGYIACAWAGVAGYGTATLLSYFVGQRHYPIPYPLRSIFVYIVLTGLLFGGMLLFAEFVDETWLRMGFNTLCMGAFALYVIKRDFPPSSLPVVGKRFRK